MEAVAYQYLVGHGRYRQSQSPNQMNRLLDRVADRLVNWFIDVLEWCEKRNINPVKTKHFGG